MGLPEALKGLLEGIGKGALEKHNVETYGPDYKQRRDESAARLKAAQLAQLLQGHQLQQLEEGQLTEEQEALQAFPQLKDPRQAVRMLKIKRSDEARGHAEQERLAGLARTGAQTAADLARPAQAKTIEERLAALEDVRSRTRARDAGVPLAETRTRKYGENIDSMIKDREGDNARADSKGTGGKPQQLSMSNYLALKKAADERAGEMYDEPTDAQRAEVLQQLLSGYESVRGAQPSVVKPKLYKLPDGRTVPWAQVPPAIQAALKAKGVGE